MNAKKAKLLRKNARINFDKSPIPDKALYKPFNRYFREVKDWYKSQNTKEREVIK